MTTSCLVEAALILSSAPYDFERGEVLYEGHKFAEEGGGYDLECYGDDKVKEFMLTLVVLHLKHDKTGETKEVAYSGVLIQPRYVFSCSQIFEEHLDFVAERISVHEPNDPDKSLS